VIVLLLILLIGPLVHAAEAQQVPVAGMFPRQWPLGLETVVHVAVQNHDPIQSVEVSPAAGVKVSRIEKGDDFQGNYTWSEFRIAVAGDAAAGPRTIVLVLPTGRSVPLTITIPPHRPSISELRVVPAALNPQALDVQFAAADPSGDLGDSPYVWFMRVCGSDIVPGVVRGKVSNLVVHASIPNATVRNKCSFQVRVADSKGIESNMLSTQF